MLDLNLIRETPDLVRTSLRNRQMDVSPVDDILRRPARDEHAGAEDLRETCEAIFRVGSLRRRNHRRPHRLAEPPA